MNSSLSALHTSLTTRYGSAVDADTRVLKQLEVLLVVGVFFT